MKKIFIIFSLLITSSIVSMSGAQADQCAVMGPNGCVLTEAQAQASDNGGAGQCNALNPCGTWAVVDPTNTVTNVIVCQPSVCGSGNFTNNTVVLQVPANDSGQPQGSVFTENPTPEQVVKYDSETKLFTQGSLSFPAPSTFKTETIDTTTLTTTIYSDVRTFGPNNFVNGQMEFTPVVTSKTGASISATNGFTKEVAFFDTPKTRSQIQASIENKLRILQQYLNRFYTLLGGWLID